MIENNDTNNSLVSVVVITYNSSKYVLETLDSIYDQTYKNIELIISDDCSTDKTVAMCVDWANKKNDRFVRTEIVTVKKNSGIPGNCNRGVKASKGEWIQLIAGDDVLEPVIIENYISFISAKKEVKCLFSNLKEYNDTFEEKNIILQVKDASKFDICQSHLNAYDQFKILLRSNKVWAVTLFLNSEVLDLMGGFDERYPFFEDRPLLLKLTKSGYKIHYLNFLGAKYRRHIDSVQKSNKTFKNQFYLSKQKYFIENHLEQFKFTERTLMKLRYKKDRFLIKLCNNKPNMAIRVIDSFIERVVFYPLKMFV